VANRANPLAIGHSFLPTRPTTNTKNKTNTQHFAYFFAPFHVGSYG